MTHEINKLIGNEKLLHERIQERLIIELKRQKDIGKKFITDEDIDSLIDDILKKEVK